MRDLDELIVALRGFEWDAGNAQKSWVAHRVTQAESEEVFFNLPVFLLEDAKHSGRERRYNVLGRTNADRLLSVIFTLRGDLVRVISARPMSRKERTAYDHVPPEAR
ncbi:MAG: BrnT family toxin [Gemmatimonadetes bacterium]|nr:BrnT family toxin [Gemmatimonadota bacterium]